MTKPITWIYQPKNWLSERGRYEEIICTVLAGRNRALTLSSKVTEDERRKEFAVYWNPNEKGIEGSIPERAYYFFAKMHESAWLEHQEKKFQENTIITLWGTKDKGNEGKNRKLSEMMKTNTYEGMRDTIIHLFDRELRTKKLRRMTVRTPEGTIGMRSPPTTKNKPFDFESGEFYYLNNPEEEIPVSGLEDFVISTIREDIPPQIIKARLEEVYQHEMN